MSAEGHDPAPPADLAGSALDERAARLAKVERLRTAGVEPYPVRFDRDTSIGEVRAAHVGLEPGTETDERVRVAGRLLLIRRQGKLIFGDLRDGSGRIQLFVSRAVIGEEAFAAVTDLDLGDWLGIEGTVMTTRKGELSINVDAAVLLAKALRPLPDKWHGLADVDVRFRQRYVDLIANDEARAVFATRFAIVREIRDFLHDRGFVEVETPVLQPVAGGATATPFVTYHNALDSELALRIAPELYLKRLVVGGLERVFEMGRVFRNEGLSTRHNPEFTMLELYQAFADYHDMMSLAEELVTHLATKFVGGTTIDWEGRTIDLALPWERATMRELIARHAGVDVHPSMEREALHRIGEDLGIDVDERWDAGKTMLEIYEKTTEPKITGPTFVCDYPREVSPFARAHRDDPFLTERFELLLAGRELANAFSELNDPLDQRSRFEAQAALKAAGDIEAGDIDDDYVRALEYGLPPSGGMGFGVDRLVMALTGTTSIREVLLFPHLRPEARP